MKAEPDRKKPQSDRRARLAAALRENLKRRKTQQRLREVEPNAPGGEGAAPAARDGGS